MNLPAEPLTAVDAPPQAPPPPPGSRVRGELPPLAQAQLEAMELGVSSMALDIASLAASAGLRTGDRVDDRALLTLSTLPSSPDVYRGNPVDVLWSAAAGPVRSWSVFNGNAFPVYIGPGSGGGIPNVATFICPPYTLLVVPANSAEVSVGADPASLVAGDATVTLIRSTAPIDSPAAYPLAAAPAAQLQGSTLTPLGGGAAYVGPDLPGLPIYSRVVGAAYSDQAGSLNLQGQLPGGQWRAIQQIVVPANTWTSIEVPATAARHRFTFANGATPQGVFELAAWSKR